MARPRIVIVGGNFAGLSAAAALDRSYDVVVVDAKPAFEWLPNIHELVSGVKDGRAEHAGETGPWPGFLFTPRVYRRFCR